VVDEISFGKQLFWMLGRDGSGVVSKTFPERWLKLKFLANIIFSKKELHQSTCRKDRKADTLPCFSATKN